jgi:glucose/arabinose dehydrogenase/plastocyanin
VLLAILLMLAFAAGWGAGTGVPGTAQDASPAAGNEATGTARLGGDLPGDPRIQLVKVAGGLEDPVAVAFPNDESGRIFVVERAGRVRIVEPDGALRERPFLDLSERVSMDRGEQGMLGLALHPDFASNGRFYVDFNQRFANGDVAVTEFRVSERDPAVAEIKSERPILTIAKPFPQHSGGTIKFGPDGYLYVAVGDGGWQGDPYDNAQSRFTLLGKILRIDVDGGGPGQPYAIPPDNPFAGPDRYDNPFPGSPPFDGAAGDEDEKDRRERGERPPGQLSPENRAFRPPVRQEIWALGFRNPWQFSFDPATGDFYVGDVGADTWEEIDFQPAGVAAGLNYGWDWLEGTHCYPALLTECSRQQVGVPPVAEYQHGDEGCAVIGIGVYRGEEFPALDGIYFSGDFCNGKIRGLQRDAAGVWQFQELLDPAMLITSSGQDWAGNLYVTARMRASRGERPERSTQDALWRIVAADKVPPGAETAPLGGGEEELLPEGGAEDAMVGESTDGDASPVAGGDGDASGGTPTAARRPRTVTVWSYDIYFDPDRVDIRADSDVRIELPNRGATLHNFTIDELGVSVDIEPGQTQEVTINAPVGKYRYYCNVPGHQQAGMVGTLMVN